MLRSYRHSDIDGNEKADVLAKLGAGLDPLRTEHMLPFISSVKTALDFTMIKKCVKRWEDPNSCRIKIVTGLLELGH